MRYEKFSNYLNVFCFEGPIVCMKVMIRELRKPNLQSTKKQLRTRNISEIILWRDFRRIKCPVFDTFVDQV